MASNLNIVYKNTISVDEVNSIRKSMGWRQLHPEQQKANLDGCVLILSAYAGDKAIAMTGLDWNGGSFAYLCVLLSPGYHNQGIEEEFTTQIFDFLRSKLRPGYGIQVNITARCGYEKLYENLGFELATPENSGGVPMRICLTNQVELTDKMFKQMGFNNE